MEARWEVEEAVVELGVGCEGDVDGDDFRTHKLLICQADKVNSDGD